MSTRESYQGGSIATFIIVGVVLFGLLGVGLFALNKYGSRDQIAKNGSDTSRGEETQPKKETPADPKKNSAETLPGDTHQESTVSGGEGSSGEQLPSGGTSTLPQTGPVDTFAQLIALGAVTFATVSYIRSRRAAHFDSAV